MRPIAYRGSSVVCRSVCRSVDLPVTTVYHAETAEPIKMPLKLWTRVEPCIRWGCRSPYVNGQFWGWNGAVPGHAGACPSVDIFKATQQGAASVRCGCWSRCTQFVCILVQPGEYDWTVRVRRRCGLTVKCLL